MRLLLTISVALSHLQVLALAFSSSSDASSRVALSGLQPSQFRHPLDRDLTERLMQLPGNEFVERGVRKIFPLVEQGVRLDLLSTAVKVSDQQRPDLYALLQQACRILDLPKHQLPDLYIQPSSQANAYTLALRGKDAPPIVVVTSALLNQCSDAEIQAVLGHELGHLLCEHSLYLTAGGLVTTPLRQLPLIGSRIEQKLQEWRLSAEYSCDRASLLVAQDFNVVASGLIKLFAGGTTNLSTDAFIQQCREYDDKLQSANPLVRAAVQQQLQSRTHPLPVRRVVALEKWSTSDEYARILVKLGKPLVDDDHVKSEIDNATHGQT
jgi:Zn-dependent protease with chaperone function